MWKSGCIRVMLMTFLFGCGNFFRMERVDHTKVTESCPEPKACNVDGFTDWFKMNGYCVKHFNDLANFTEAEFSCRKKAPGAHLVSVHSETDNKYLLSILKKSNPNNLCAWLGGFEFFQTGKFFWLDASFWDYQMWSQGEPRNVYSNLEECVEMNWKGDGKWNDDTCSVKKNYICAFKQRNMLEVDAE